MNLNWKKPLFYVLLPILVLLCFVGFPPPFAPPRITKPAQEQSETVKKEEAEGLGISARDGQTGLILPPALREEKCNNGTSRLLCWPREQPTSLPLPS